MKDSPELPDYLQAIARSLEGNLGEPSNASCPSMQQGDMSNPMQLLFGNIMDKFVDMHPSENPQQSCQQHTHTESQLESSSFDYEIVESEKDLHVMVDMPGVEKQSIFVTYDAMPCSPGNKKTLNITATRNARSTNVIKSTVKYGLHVLRLLLKKASQSITSDDITAKYDNGILMIVVPKGNETAPKAPKFVHIS